MGKQNYRESVEKDRQEIAVERSSAPSRRAKRNAVKEKPKKSKNMLLPALFFIFILIPVTILIYVAFLFEPDDTLPTNESANEVSVESGSASPDAAAVPLEEEDQAKKEAAAKAQAEKEAAAKAQAEKEAAAKAQAEKEAAAKAQAEKEAAAKAQAEKEAAAKAQAEKEQAAKAQAEAKKQQEQAAAKAQAEKEAAENAQTPPASSKTHTVQTGETLYRIAVNTYGAAGASAGVEKIKQANGLGSNEISVGQTLVLP